MTMPGITLGTADSFTQHDSSHSVPASSPFTITPTVPNSGVWSADMGVNYSAIGLPFTEVSSDPTVGQYAVSAGVYTFAAADEGVAVTISYTYTASVTITTAPLRGGVFQSTTAYYALTQITMMANYMRLGPAGAIVPRPPSIGGFPGAATRRPAIDDFTNHNAGVVPSGTTCWAWTIEANALISAGAATATGQYA